MLRNTFCPVLRIFHRLSVYDVGGCNVWQNPHTSRHNWTQWQAWALQEACMAGSSDAINGLFCASNDHHHVQCPLFLKRLNMCFPTVQWRASLMIIDFLHPDCQVSMAGVGTENSVNFQWQRFLCRRQRDQFWTTLDLGWAFPCFALLVLVSVTSYRAQKIFISNILCLRKGRQR